METKFSNLGNILSRQQTKQIIGGDNFTCNASAAPGYKVANPGSCSGSFAACNLACDSWCVSTPGCSTCTCS